VAAEPYVRQRVAGGARGRQRLGVQALGGREIAGCARRLGLYTNLITSAVGLTLDVARHLKAAGLDHVRISIQAAEVGLPDAVAGAPVYQPKVAAARLVKSLGFAFTLNCVLRRHNIEQVAELIALAEELGADRLELANTQYYGWALRNRPVLQGQAGAWGRPVQAAAKACCPGGTSMRVAPSASAAPAGSSRVALVLGGT
jgi:hypothetical protein